MHIEREFKKTETKIGKKESEIKRSREIDRERERERERVRE